MSQPSDEPSGKPQRPKGIPEGYGCLRDPGVRLRDICLAHPGRGNQEVGRRAIVRDRNVVEHGDAQQRLDVDVKALLRIAVLYDIPIANNRASADFLISSSLMGEAYQTNPDDRIR